jgi:hypothetical protein
MFVVLALSGADLAHARDAGPLLNSPAIELDEQQAANLPPLRQVWVISSRRGTHLEFWSHGDQRHGWTLASQEEFLATDQPHVATCVYVHGNRIHHAQALRDGWQVYQQIAGCLPPEQPLRFVIWSWPSTEIEGPLQDVRLKACVSDTHAGHLACLVDRINPDVPVSLVGYSFGARLIGGALHLLGGGRLAGHALQQRTHPHRAPLRVVLMAGALDSHALTPHGRNGLAASQVERMLVTVNSKDPVLHHYPLLAGLLRKGPPALGYTGFFASSLGEEGHKVAQWNVACYVGKEHDWRRYLYSPAILSRLRSYVLFDD